MEYLFGLMLEQMHQMINDMHAPKATFERRLGGAWKKHIERKRATAG